jgi:hypothetical protein
MDELHWLGVARQPNVFEMHTNVTGMFGPNDVNNFRETSGKVYTH